MKTDKATKTTLVACGILLAALAQNFCGAAVAKPNDPVTTFRAAGARTFSARATGDGFSIAVSNGGKISSSPDGTSWIEMDEVNNFLPTFFRGVTYANGIFVVVGGSYVAVPSVIVTLKNGRDRAFRDSGIRNNLYGVAYGNGRFVAVGDHDTILSSKDGIHWRKRNSRTSDTLFASVAFGSGIFVAVGDSGTILSSNDGVRWQPRMSGTSMYLNKVGYENRQFVIRVGDGISLVSTDGLAWSLRGGAHDFVVAVSVDQ